MGSQIEHKKDFSFIDEYDAVVDVKDAWYKNGVLHRDGKPAIVTKDRVKIWYDNGVRHREGAPAVEFPDGGYRWYHKGMLHRADGPAVLVCRGRSKVTAEYWYLNGELHREDGPALINFKSLSHGWYRHGKLHKEDGPAYKCESGEEWRVNGLLHRIDGPASFFLGERAMWAINGKYHRTDGPAIHAVDMDGKYVETEEDAWYFEGKPCLREDHPYFKSKTDGPPKGAKQKRAVKTLAR